MHDTSREPYLTLQRCFGELAGQIHLVHDKWQEAIHTQNIERQLDLIACQKNLLSDALVIITALQHLTSQGGGTVKAALGELGSPTTLLFPSSRPRSPHSR